MSKIIKRVGGLLGLSTPKPPPVITQNVPEPPTIDEAQIILCTKCCCPLIVTTMYFSFLKPATLSFFLLRIPVPLLSFACLKQVTLLSS